MSNDPTPPPIPPPPPDATAAMPAQPPAVPPPGSGRGSGRWIVVVVVVVLLALAGAITAIALGGEDQDEAAGPTDEPTVTAPTSPTGTTGPSTRPTGSTGTTGSSNPGCSGAPAPASLADGTYFGFLESISVGSGVSEFDLACFYTGDEANEQAAARGDEVPVPNDVYIVNDNPSIRDVPVDPAVELMLIDWNACCETSPGAELDAFASALGGQDLVEIDGFRYAGSLSPYWITIEGGRIVGIEEQFLP